MRFEFALRKLRYGHRVRRESWKRIAFLKKEGAEITAYVPEMYQCWSYQFSSEEILAEDWELAK